MSRGYSGTDRSVIESAPLSVEPFTFAAWAAFDSDNNAGQCVISLASSSSTQNQAFLNCSFDQTGNPVNMSVRRAGTFYQCYTANGITADGGWNHLAGVVVGVAERYSYCNGNTANKGTTTTTYTNSLSGQLNRTCIGSLYSVTTLTQTVQGKVAHPAIWSAALTDAEIVMLSQGVSPLLVRPQSLVFYMPYLGRDTSDIDIEGGRLLVNTGTTSQSSEPRVTRATDRNSTKVFLPPTPIIGIGTPVSTAITSSGTVDVSVTLANPNDGLIVVVTSSNWSNQQIPSSDKKVIFNPGGANERTILSTEAVLFSNNAGQFDGNAGGPCAIFYFTKERLPASGTYTVRWLDESYVDGSTVLGVIPVTNNGVGIRVRQKAIAYNRDTISGVTIDPLIAEFEKNTATGSLFVAAGLSSNNVVCTINRGTSLWALNGGFGADAFNCSYAVNPSSFKTFQLEEVGAGIPPKNGIIGVEFESGSTPVLGSVNFSASASSMARVASAVRTAYPFSMFAMVKPYSVPSAGPTDRQFGVLVLDNSAANADFQRLNLANSEFGNVTTGYPAGYIIGLARSRFQTSSINEKLTSNASYYQLNQWAALGGTWATATTTPEVKAYKDGIDRTVSLSNNAVTFSSSINETLIGREATFLANTGRNFDGLISRVAIWSSVLTESEILSLSDGADPRTIQSANLVCYWPGDVIGIKAHNAAVGQYMNEVVQGKYALLSNGAVSVLQDPTYRGIQFLSYPNVIIAMSGLSGVYTDVDEDPQSPDTNWLNNP